ncbi:hypothetical protein Bca4012_006626 [Brassica carinata]|uniref:Uncharacterized protein n=1 Tax=Brassica carinata TaxID=52824 RepID=A0A8X7RQX0_BRACI|nr:hypothetical protein Bca52824_039181 [Brassica carinata]
MFRIWRRTCYKHELYDNNHNKKHLVAGSQLWVRVRCFFFRCCRPSLEVPVAARNASRDSIRVSLVVSVLQSRTLDCGSA